MGYSKGKKEKKRTMKKNENPRKGGRIEYDLKKKTIGVIKSGREKNRGGRSWVKGESGGQNAHKIKKK